MLQLKFISKRQRKSNTRKTKSKLTNKLIKIIFIRADPLSFKITYSGGLWNNWYLFVFSPWCYWRLNDPLRYLIQSILAFVFLFCFVLFCFVFFYENNQVFSINCRIFIVSRWWLQLVVHVDNVQCDVWDWNPIKKQNMYEPCPRQQWTELHRRL